MLLLLAGLACTYAAAESSPATPSNWEEADAIAAIASVDTVTQISELNRLATTGDSAALLERAVAIHEYADWPAPAREFVLFNLAMSLGDMPHGQVDREVTDYLVSVSPVVRVEHPDHPAASVPMFNIAAAAYGAMAEWERQAASAEAHDLISLGPHAWLDAYLRVTPVQREGYLRSAATYTDPELTGLAEAALGRVEAHPGSARIATMAGLRIGDPVLFSDSLKSNEHNGLAEMIRASTEVFPPGEQQNILLQAVRHAPASTASLVIAELAPALLDQPLIENLMFELLADLNLGASAALALSKSDSPRHRTRLTQISLDEPGLAASRAALALAAMEAGR